MTGMVCPADWFKEVTGRFGTRGTEMTMSYREALDWLDEHGGHWCVQATRATCFVVATLGPAKVRAPVRFLDAAEVNDAIVVAVTELQHREGESLSRSSAAGARVPRS
jgi:hypothetical protein